MYYSRVVFFIFCWVALGGSAKLPASFKKCKISDPNVGDCLRYTVEDIVRKSAAGAPEVGLQSLDPLDITKLVIGQGSGPVNVQQNFKNVKLHGLTNVKVLSYRVSDDLNTHYAETMNPELVLDADYELNGRILLLPIQGKGRCKITLINAWLNHTSVMEHYQKKGKEFIRSKEYKVTIVPERMVFQFDNLFNGDKLLGDEINRVINENWDAIFNDVRSGYDDSFGIIFQGLSNSIFNRVPFDNLYVK